MLWTPSPIYQVITTLFVKSSTKSQLIKLTLNFHDQ